MDLVWALLARDMVHDGLAPLVVGDQGLRLSAVDVQPILNRVRLIIGTVEEGKAADLLLVTADPTLDISNLRRLRYVVRGGVIRHVDELAAVASAPASP